MDLSGSDISFSAGNVGIGTTSPATKLDVAGGVKVANETTCNSSKAGTIRWTGSAFEGCNGSNWVSLSGAGGGITSCPAGWTMIGDPGKTATFCIETNERSGATYFNAKNTCNNINDSTHGRAHLCTHNEWHTACMRGSGLQNMTGGATSGWEWVADFGHVDPFDAIVVGANGCSSLDNWDANSATVFAFRCCLR